MVIEELRSVFADWTDADFAARGIAFRENFEPDYDYKQDSYRVIYEVAFEPEQLDKARLEFWLTDNGYVAIGIENYQRLGNRLSLRTFRRGFAAGCEPGATTKEALSRFFTVVALGQLVITVNTPFWIIACPKLHIPETDFRTISDTGYSSARWLAPLPEDPNALRSSRWVKTLPYAPW